MAFSDELRAAAAALWTAQSRHPFVRGIGDGTLDEAAFRFYVRQDYVFLIEYGRVLAFACARAPRVDWMERFAEVARATLHEEMELHRGYAARWQISRAQLEAEPADPVTRAYTDFLLSTAAARDFCELAAALLPCMWGYSELGRELAARGRPAHALYAEWIDSYADDGFAELAAWCRGVVDAIGAEAPQEARARMHAAFTESSRHELAFWEAAWQAGATGAAAAR